MYDPNGREHATAKLISLENVDVTDFDTYCWDGTFKIVRDCPEHYQLVILSGLVTGQNGQKRSYPIPIAYGLLPGASTSDYLLFLRNLNRLSGYKLNIKERFNFQLSIGCTH